jgi:hypothetical protein
MIFNKIVIQILANACSFKLSGRGVDAMVAVYRWRADRWRAGKLPPFLVGGSTQLFSKSVLHSQSRRIGTCLKRRALVQQFPSSFSFNDLMAHFTSAYKKVIGFDAPTQVIGTIVWTFVKLWVTVRKISVS